MFENVEWRVDPWERFGKWSLTRHFSTGLLLMIEHFAIISSIEELPMNEIFFLVEEAPEGGFTAKGLGESIFTEADNLEELHANVRDAVRCHFDEANSMDFFE